MSRHVRARCRGLRWTQKRRDTNLDGSPRCCWRMASPRRWSGCVRPCSATAMSKKMLDSLVGFAQAATNLLVLGGTYWAVSAVRAALGHPYVTANRLAVEAVFPYLVVLYVVLWLVYRLPAYYETAPYEGVLSQVFVQLILALASLATSFVVRAFAFPRGLVATAFQRRPVLRWTVASPRAEVTGF